MASRTQIFSMLPCVGGLDTSNDEAMIATNKLTVCDHVVCSTSGSRKSREGNDYDYDDIEPGSATVLAQHDFWSGTSGSKTQKHMSILSDGKVYSEVGGTRTLLADGGKAWSGPLTSASFLTFNNKLLVAVSGSSNLVKTWDGSGSLADLKNATNQTVVARSSSGTTRTLKLSSSFLGVNGDDIIVESSTNASYNGTFTVLSVTTGSLTNDTITYTGPDPLTEGSTSDSDIRVHLAAPKMSILGEHLGRIWGNDKTNNDRLNYCTTFNHEQWGGFGDSGAQDVGVGDGDSRGVVGFKSFKGTLFVGKSNRLYRVSGYVPEEFQNSLISDGIGLVSHDAIATVDQDSLVFVSEKGIHDLATTDTYGDFASQYVSKDIQKTFTTSFSKSRLPNIKAAYLPTLNSVVFAVTETQSQARVNSTASTNNSLYFYNIPFQLWYRWPDVSCESILVANDSDKKRLYLGSYTGRIAKTFTGSRSDTSATGVPTQIKYSLKTGIIFPSGNPYEQAAFKRFILYYRPIGTHSLTVNVYIDNNALNPENSLLFNEATGGTPLGTGFKLGSTRLGSSRVLAPYTRQIDGMGHGCKIEISQTSTSGEVEIQGFAIEWEPIGHRSEVA